MKEVPLYVHIGVVIVCEPISEVVAFHIILRCISQTYPKNYKNIRQPYSMNETRPCCCGCFCCECQVLHLSSTRYGKESCSHFGAIITHGIYNRECWHCCWVHLWNICPHNLCVGVCWRAISRRIRRILIPHTYGSVGHDTCTLSLQCRGML